MSAQASRVAHHFTVDVEEYFQVSAMEPYVSRDRWDAIDTRVALGTRRILELLGTHNARGTFFVLGWIAKRHAELVREIVDDGHEIASHGWGHERITTISPAQFRESIRSSKSELESITGTRILGYRAPSFSIIRGGEWALDMLVEEGYAYDSSLYPVERRGYGYAGGACDPHVIHRPAGVLYEFPPATLSLGTRIVPAGGGAYLRHFPYAFVRTAMQAAERRGQHATFYIHPWELDPEQPRISVPFLTRMRHYGGITRTEPRIGMLLRDFAFQTIASTLAEMQSAAPPARAG